MKTNIIEICQGQPRLALMITQPGCDGSQLMHWEDTRLVIRAPNCPTCCVLLSPTCFCGCWPGHDVDRWNAHDCPPHEHPILIYDAFNRDDAGRIVFLFDSLLYQRPPGRYLGEVQFKNGRHIVSFEIDLCSRPFILNDAQTITVGGSCDC